MYLPGLSKNYPVRACSYRLATDYLVFTAQDGDVLTVSAQRKTWLDVAAWLQEHAK